MNGGLGNAELESFQRAVAARLGLRFDDGKLTFLAEVLARRVEARGVSTTSYLSSLTSELEAPDELGALARELTVGETYFFRHADQFDALEQVALPERRTARGAGRALRLLSAGCASGEEAYSLAILLKRQGREQTLDFEIQGLDLNPDGLEKARRARYSPWSLRETPVEVRERWFRQHGRDYQLDESIRSAVRFDQHNLILSSPALLPARSFDVIFCRNVLMYFTTEHASAIVAQLARALALGGFLFLGHAETLRGLSSAFHLRHTHNTFYYQLREHEERRSLDVPDAALLLPARGAAPAAPLTPGDWVGTWLETIERSSNRIKQLSDAGAGEPAPGRPHEASRSHVRDLSQPLELLRSERYAEALAAIQLLPTHSGDSAALLLRAALLTHQGELAQAENACHDLIRLDELNAGAHYLLALCLERRGQNESAIEHDLIAVYLDAGFAMPHLHMGLMARRRGDTGVARQELGQALALLEREEPSRLLLFGGGFSRGALSSLCRSELANLGAVT